MVTFGYDEESLLIRQLQVFLFVVAFDHLQLRCYTGEYAKKYIKEQIEPMVKAQLPGPFKAFRFENMDMGDIPFRVGGIKVTRQRELSCKGQLHRCTRRMSVVTKSSWIWMLHMREISNSSCRVACSRAALTIWR